MTATETVDAVPMCDLREARGACRIIGPEVCSRILLVGETNPYGADPRYALYYEPTTSAGGRLQRLVFALEPRRWYLPLWRTNLCTGSWDADEASDRAAELFAPGSPWFTIVLLGVKVRTAFARAGAVFMPDSFQTGVLRRTDGTYVTIATLPHPSGRSHAYADLANVSRARDTMRLVAPAIPWGDLG